ncbi:MAG: glycosyltransferase family 87 protein [Terracidiphilus sp.]|jgi:glycosyl transferase family 87
MGSSKRWIHRTSLLLLLVGAGISLAFGISLERGVRGGVMGFPGIYFGTKCLMQGCDPYQADQLQRVYQAEGFQIPSESVERTQSVSLYVNLPTTSLFVAPLTLLPLAWAQAVWLSLVVGSFLLAAFLMWQTGAAYSTEVSLLLTFVILSNCEIIFSGGNTAGLVVGLCVIAVWCLLKERFVILGIICLASSLAIKPHDVGLIWLYFLLAGRVQRIRALQAGGLALALGVIGAMWATHIAPHWVPELRSNLATISAHGGINEPGPTSIGVGSPDMIIDLQTFVSILRDDPHFYNPVTYTVCGAFLLAWLIVVLRSGPSSENALFALVSVAALSMLVTYHRSYDAKLLLLSVPACALLWAEGGATAWLALPISTAGVFFTGDLPLTILMHLTRHMYSPAAGIAGKIATAVITRPAPLILLVTAIFYLWVYARRTLARSSNERA